MKKMNYEVIERYGKLSVKHANMKRNIRIERQFGEDYTIDVEPGYEYAWQGLNNPNKGISISVVSK